MRPLTASLPGVLVVFLGSVAEAQPTGSTGKDTAAAAYTRNTVLKAKVTVVYKDLAVGEVLKDLADQLAMAKVRPPKFTFDPAVARATKVTYSAKEKPFESILDDIFRSPGLGYVVVSAEDDRRDGWLKITVGKERGFPAGVDPKAVAEEQEAGERLDVAKGYIKDGKLEKAKPLLSAIVKRHAGTKAAAEAAKLLEGLK